MFSEEKAPERGDTAVVEPAVIQQIWQDLEPFRVQTRVAR